jgi:hypothetical protein
MDVDFGLPYNEIPNFPVSIMLAKGAPSFGTIDKVRYAGTFSFL